MKRKLLLPLVLLFSCLWTKVYAASGTEGAAFLDIPVGAGPAALGSAYSALSSDAYAPIYNPAGLGSLRVHEIAGQHLSYLESISYEFASVAFRIGARGGLAASMQYLGSGDIPGSTYDGAVTPDYSSHYGAYSLAYGHTFGQSISLGATFKFLEAKISDVSGRAYAGDIGALYKVSERTRLAATLNNFGSQLTFMSDGDPLPLAGHLGIATEPFRRLLLSADVSYGKTKIATGRFGAQWRPIDLIALRAGYRTDTTSELGALAGLSTGIGLQFWGQEFSYAWLPYGDLGNTQYFSLLLRFGSTDNSQQNLLEAQDMKRRQSVSADKDDVDGRQLMELLKTTDEKSAQTSSEDLR
jgi:hypothetical protein